MFMITCHILLLLLQFDKGISIDIDWPTHTSNRLWCYVSKQRWDYFNFIVYSMQWDCSGSMFNSNLFEIPLVSTKMRFLKIENQHKWLPVIHVSTWWDLRRENVIWDHKQSRDVDFRFGICVIWRQN